MPSGVSPSFLWSGQRKEAKETPQPQAGRTHRACFVRPPPFGRWFALLGALLYASRWHAQESSIGRLWGGEAPQSRGYHSPPRVESEGDFLLRKKAPHTPKETASYQSTANYIVVIEQLPPPIGRVVRFITAKLACARAYTSLQGYMNDEKKSPALRFASGSIFFPRPCLRLSGAHCLTAYENDDNTTDRLRHKKVDHPI